MDQDLNRYLTKDGKQAYEKMFHIMQHQGNAIKIMRCYISYPLGWPKSRTLTTPKAEKNAE